VVILLNHEEHKVHLKSTKESGERIITGNGIRQLCGVWNYYS
jgi:hypothetical protein